MENNRFWQAVALAFFMVFCICLNIISIIMGIENENNTSVILGGTGIGVCLVALVYNIISAIENHKK